MARSLGFAVAKFYSGSEFCGRLFSGLFLRQDLGVGDVAELEGEVRVSVPVLARKLRQLLSPEADG